MTDQTNDTKYHDLTLPAAGYDAADPSWDELLNSAFDGIDARLELRGTLAERPSTAPDGAKYVVDDPDDEHDGERFVYRAATDAWELRPGKFSAVATEELLTAGRHGEVFVYERSGTYYAVGADSVISEDANAHTVLQAAQDSLPDNQSSTGPVSGGRIYVGPGRYILDSTLNIDREGVSLFGSGFNGEHGPTVIEAADGLNANLIDIDFHTSLSNSWTYIANMAIDGNTANNSSGKGIHFGPNERDNKLENLFVLKTADDGVFVEQSWGLVMADCLVELCDGWGVELDGNGSEGKIVNCKINKNAGRGLHSSASQVKVGNCEFASNGDIGLALNGEDNSAANNRIEGNGSPQALANADYVTYTGNIVTGDSGDAFKVNSGNQDVRFTGNTIYNLNPMNDGGKRTIVNGRYWTPPTVSLGGFNGSIVPTDNQLTRYHLRIDAGGSASNLQGINNIDERGTVVVVEHAGGENVVLEDDNSGASNPLKNTSGADETLDANGEMAGYVYDGSAWRQMWSNTQA